MAKYTTSFTADASLTKICNVHMKKGVDQYFATVCIYGTGGNNFGSGTVTMFVSPDGGTTKVALKDAISGTAISTTSSAMFTVRLGNGSTNSDNLMLYATVAGSTNPSISVTVADNSW